LGAIQGIQTLEKDVLTSLKNIETTMMSSFFLCADNDNSLRFCGVVSAFRDVQSKSNSAYKPHQEMTKQKG